MAVEKSALVAGAGEESDVVDVSEVTRVDPLEVAEPRLVSGEPVTGVAQPLVSEAGEVLSDLHCPLLVDEEDIIKKTVVETHTNDDGDVVGRTVLRTPLQVVNTPVGCPTCGKIVERHMLVPDSLGVSDCAIAINARARGKDPSKILGAAPGDATAIANDTPLDANVPGAADQLEAGD